MNAIVVPFLPKDDQTELDNSLETINKQCKDFKVLAKRVADSSEAAQKLISKRVSDNKEHINKTNQLLDKVKKVLK